MITCLICKIFFNVKILQNTLIEKLIQDLYGKVKVIVNDISGMII